MRTSIMMLGTMVLLIVSMVACADELVKVIEFATAGAHAPAKIFPFAKRESENFKNEDELTPLGIR